MSDLHKVEGAKAALERRVRYAEAHPIPGLLSKGQLDALREAHEEETVYFDGLPLVIARVECRADRQTWPCDAMTLLRHIDALERERPVSGPCT